MFISGQENNNDELLEIAEPDFFSSDDVHVMKKGTATGVTRGVYGGFFMSTNVRFEKSPTGPFFTFENCYRIDDKKEQFFDTGDSGSGVFLLDKEDSRVKALGIAFARWSFQPATLVCKVKHIAESFNLTIIKDDFSKKVFENFNEYK